MITCIKLNVRVFSNKTSYHSLLHLLGVIISVFLSFSLLRLFLLLFLSLYLCVCEQLPLATPLIQISLSTRTEFYPWNNILFKKVLFYQVYKVLLCLKQSFFLNCMVEISCSPFFGIISSFVYESIKKPVLFAICCRISSFGKSIGSIFLSKRSTAENFNNDVENNQIPC